MVEVQQDPGCPVMDSSEISCHSHLDTHPWPSPPARAMHPAICYHSAFRKPGAALSSQLPGESMHQLIPSYLIKKLETLTHTT